MAGDALDKKNGFEAPSALVGEADVSEVLEDAMAGLHAARVALCDGQERTSDFRVRVLGGYGTLSTTGSADDAIQGYASHGGSQGLLQNSTASKSQCVLNPRDLGGRACWNLTACVERPTPFFLTAERAGVSCSDGFPCSLKAAYTEASEFTDLASTPGKRLAWQVERVRRATSGETSNIKDSGFLQDIL